MSNVKRAYVVGFYGVSNFGDDLFCEVMRTQSAVLLPNHRVFVVGGDVRRNWDWLGLNILMQRAFASVSVSGSIWRTLVGVWVLIRADVIVLGGGSTLTRLVGVRALQCRLAKYTHTSFEALGVSIGPFKTDRDREQISEFVRGMNRIVVRDSKSLSIGHELGLRSSLSLGGDLAAIYRSGRSRTKAHADANKRFGLALCNFEGSESTSASEIAPILAREVRSDGELDSTEVTVISMNNHPTHGDDQLSKEAVELLRSQGIDASLVRYADLGVEQTWALISELDGIIAVRLHAAITAYLAEVPFALFEYQSKCSDFCDEVGQDNSLRISKNSDLTKIEQSVRSLMSGPTEPRVPNRVYLDRAQKTYGVAKR